MKDRFRIQLACSLLAIASLYVLSDYAPSCSIRINRTESLPQTVFIGRPISGDIQRGDYAVVSIPQCPIPVVKQVVGLPGDSIEIADGRIQVGTVHRGIVSHDLAPIDVQVIPEDHFYVWGEHPDSFDSRYAAFGLVRFDEIEEVVWPLF